MLASPRDDCATGALGQLSWWSSVGQSLVNFGINVTNGTVIRKMGNTLFDGAASQGDDHTQKKVNGPHRMGALQLCVFDARQSETEKRGDLQVCARTRVCVCVCVCVCVHGRESASDERERECVCVCMCVRARARARHVCFSMSENQNPTACSYSK